MKTAKLLTVLLCPILLLSLLLLVGCYSPPPNPDDYGFILKEIRSFSKQWENVDSYRYQIVGTTNSTITDGLGITRAHAIEWEDEGAYASPDRLAHTHTLRVHEEGWSEWSTRTLESVCIGSKWYEREVGGIQWVVRDDSPFSKGWLLSVDESLLSYIDSLEVGTTRLPNETIRGTDCLHYKGKVNMDAYVDELPDYLYSSERFRQWLRHMDRTVELWIGEGDRLIRKCQMDERHPYGALDITPWDSKPEYVGIVVTEFYDYNQSIEIELPAL